MHFFQNAQKCGCLLVIESVGPREIQSIVEEITQDRRSFRVRFPIENMGEIPKSIVSVSTM